MWEAKGTYPPALYTSCTRLKFLNLSYIVFQSGELAKLFAHRPQLRRLWVLDTVEDKGLEAIGLNYPLLEELRVFPANPFDEEIILGVTDAGFVDVSYGCLRLHYVLYFCRQMTNAVVATIV